MSPSTPRPRSRLPLAEDDSLRVHLDALVRSTDRASRLASDPLGLVHELSREDDREIVGLLAATLAFGNVVAIRRSIGRVLAILGERPTEMLARTPERALTRRLEGFVHRVYRGPDVARMLARATVLREKHGSLGRAFARHLDDDSRDGLVHALAMLADELRGPSPSRGLSHLVPDVRKGSATKRLFLYLRWMVRRGDGIDLGLWPDVSPRLLVIPVDTHVHRIARNLGLTRRPDASLRTALEITSGLARLDPSDPVRYDFALCHLGVSRACPSRREATKCAACTVKPVCTRWR
jgi:uncharacterized protein (TIGR02757 family)